MSYSVSLCGTGCCGCPAVEVSPSGVTIGEGDNSMKLTPEEWNLLIDKIKSGELAAIGEAAENESCGCDCCG